MTDNTPNSRAADNQPDPNAIALLPPPFPLHDTLTTPPPLPYRTPTTRQLVSVSRDPRDWTPCHSQTIGNYYLYTPRSARQVLLDAWDDLLVRLSIKAAADKFSAPNGTMPDGTPEQESDQ